MWRKFVSYASAGMYIGAGVITAAIAVAATKKIVDKVKN